MKKLIAILAIMLMVPFVSASDGYSLRSTDSFYGLNIHQNGKTGNGHLIIRMDGYRESVSMKYIGNDLWDLKGRVTFKVDGRFSSFTYSLPSVQSTYNGTHFTIMGDIIPVKNLRR